MNNIKLTTMCIVYREDGSFLVQNRLKKDWPGLTFPGGKVEKEELIEDSCRREMLEETGLILEKIENVGFFEWNTIEENVRHLAILYRCDKFHGDLKSSDEGPVFFIKEDEIKNFELSNDFLDLYNQMKWKD